MLPHQHQPLIEKLTLNSHKHLAFQQMHRSTHARAPKGRKSPDNIVPKADSRTRFQTSWPPPCECRGERRHRKKRCKTVQVHGVHPCISCCADTPCVSLIKNTTPCASTTSRCADGSCIVCMLPPHVSCCSGTPCLPIMLCCPDTPCVSIFWCWDDQKIPGGDWSATLISSLAFA